MLRKALLTQFELDLRKVPPSEPLARVELALRTVLDLLEVEKAAITDDIVSTLLASGAVIEGDTITLP